MNKLLEFSRKHPIFTALEAILFILAAQLIIRPGAAPDNYGVADVLLRFLLSIAAGAFLHTVSGDKTFSCSDRKTIQVILGLGIFWILGALICVILLITGGVNHAQLTDGWLLKLNLLFILCLATGSFEETLYIGVINDSVISRFRRLKWAFVLSAIIHALVFGAVQFIGADFSSDIMIAASVLKAVSAVLFSLCMLMLYWRTRNIWALAMVRAITDFLSLAPVIIFENADFCGYVGMKTPGVVAAVIYGIKAVTGLIILILLASYVKKNTDFTKLRHEW